MRRVPTFPRRPLRADGGRDDRPERCASPPAGCSCCCWPVASAAPSSPPRAARTNAAPAAALFNDSHFHLTNYIQEGTDARDFLQIMGTRSGASTLFGIPLQQQWSYAQLGRLRADLLPADATRRSTTTRSPTRYIAMAYRSLPPAEQARFDPMITGFNPTDMYAADHIRRVLTTFPGVFSRHRRVHDPQGVRLVEDRRARRRA